VKIALLIGAAVIVIALVGVGIWAWTPDRSRADLSARYLGASTRYLEVAGTTLRVRDTGEKAAPAIILLHGFGSSLETWEPWAQALSADYRVVRFDLPGSGLSEADRSGRYDDARSLELIGALMDHLGIDRAVLVGNSIGGRLAWKYAARFPARVVKLVLISPDGFASPGFDYGKTPQVPAVLGLMKYFLPKSLLRTNLAAAYADAGRLGDGTVDRYHDLMLAPGNRVAMLDRLRQTVLEDPVPLLRQIEVPTLLMWGEKDRLIPHTNAADYMRALPHATLMSFADLGHVPQEESPAESLPPLQQFLAQ
jgi:pimeloyl-ACP methyl ester carboxylesterase